MIEGQDIYLRELKPEDVSQAYVDWMNDPDIMRFTEARFKQWSFDELTDFVKKCYNSQSDYMFGIFDKVTHNHIGNIKLGPVNPHHKFASIGLIIGNKDYWGKGIATDAIQLVTAFAFDELKLNKVTAGAYANNTASIKAFEKCGFNHEGLLAKNYQDQDEYVDAVLLGRIAS